MQIVLHRSQVDAFQHARAGGRAQVLYVGERQDARLGGHVDVVACAVEHLSNEPHHVVVLGAVLRVGHQLVGQPRALFLGGAGGTRAGQAHALHLVAALAYQQLGRAAAEEHVGVAVQQHGAARRAVDEVHQQVLRRERLQRLEALAARQHHLADAPPPDGVERRFHVRAPRVTRVGLQLERDGTAVATRRSGGLAGEPRDAARIDRAQRVHLQIRAAIVLDEDHFGQHELQAGKRLEQLVGRRRVLGVETVEREEDGLLADGAFELAFDAVERRQRNAAPHAHEPDGAVFAIVDELVGETLLQRAIRIDNIGLDRLRV